jgi:hypothetical protein
MAKSLIRSGNRRGTRSNQRPPVAKRTGRLPDPAACERCGATFVGRTWRNSRRVPAALLERAAWTTCPACAQVARGEYFGRVLVGGAFVAGNEAAIRRRIANVDARAQFNQPQRRVLSAARNHGTIEVLTTSQKLAHRITRELKKAFGGRVTYRWSDQDGSLFATWQHD